MQENGHLYDYDNGSTTQEFPYWQPLLAIEIVLNYTVILPSTLFWNLTVFAALIRSKLSNNPLTVLYSSLLLVLCVDKIVAAIITATFSPHAIRFCTNILTAAFLFSFTAFSTVFSVLIVTFQSLLQLQIIRGKKQWNSYGWVILFIGVSALTGIFWYGLIFFSKPYHQIIARHYMYNTKFYFKFAIQQYINHRSIFCVYNASSFCHNNSHVSMVCIQLFMKMSIRQIVQDYKVMTKKLLFMPILMLFLISCNVGIGFLLSTAISELLYS